MHSFGGCPRERIQILLWFIQSSLLSKLWVRCFWLGDLDIQIFSSYGDRSQISQMKVTDGWGTVCCHHSPERCGHLALDFLEFYDDRFQIFSTRNKLLRDHGCALSSWWLVEFEIQLTWYFLSEHGSETRHGKDRSLARSSEVRVYLWSECSGVVTDLWCFSWFNSTSVRNSGPACFINFCRCYATAA